MSLKKILRNYAGQAALEYIILMVVAIVALLASSFFTTSGKLYLKLKDHFNKAQSRITTGF